MSEADIIRFKNNEFFDQIDRLYTSENQNKDLLEILNALAHLLSLYRDERIINLQNQLSLFKVLKDYTNKKTISGDIGKDERELTESLFNLISESRKKIAESNSEMDFNKLMPAIKNIISKQGE